MNFNKQEVKNSLDLYAKGLINPMISKITNYREHNLWTKIQKRPMLSEEQD